MPDNVRVVADYEQQIDELLGLAFVRKDDKGAARKALKLAIEVSRASRRLLRRSRRFHGAQNAKQRRKLANQIEQTLDCLQEVKQHWDGVAIVVQPVGSGLIAVAAPQEMFLGRALDLPLNPSVSDGELLLPTITEAGAAAVNVELMLRAILLRLRNMQKPRDQKPRGKRADLAKQAIVRYAVTFFKEHSFVPASADARKLHNPLHEFVEGFYGVVTGNETDATEFDWYIKKTMKELKN